MDFLHISFYTKPEAHFFASVILLIYNENNFIRWKWFNNE